MRRRRKWRAPNDPTGPAKQVWAALYPREPWPKGWRVAWAGFMRGAAGLCVHSQRLILLSYGDHAGKARRYRSDPVVTLVHELVHVRAPKLRHGAEFRRIEASMLSRLNLERGTT